MLCYSQNRIYALGAFLLLLLLCGCSPEEQQHFQQDTHNLAQDIGDSLRKATLTSKVAAVLSVRKGVDMKGLHLDSDDGNTITVSGHVHNQEEKKRVLETINGITGVDKVVDKLRIEP